MNFLDRILYEPSGGQFREFAGVTTHLAPADLSLYRDILPQPLSIPSCPTVTIFIADYMKVFSWPMTPYREWSVLLRCRYEEHEAWYPITMPVTAWIPMKGGRRIGFPKYVMENIALSKEGDTITGTAVHNGILQLELRFSAGHSRQLSDWEKELADNEAFFKGGCLCLVPPGVGPHVVKLDLIHVVPPKWTPQHGMVTVHANPGESWTALLAEDGPFPGTYNHFIGGINLHVERLA